MIQIWRFQTFKKSETKNNVTIAVNIHLEIVRTKGFKKESKVENFCLFNKVHMLARGASTPFKIICTFLGNNARLAKEAIF